VIEAAQIAHNTGSYHAGWVFHAAWFALAHELVEPGRNPETLSFRAVTLAGVAPICNDPLAAEARWDCDGFSGVLAFRSPRSGNASPDLTVVTGRSENPWEVCV
jgi:hypothetical protein